MSGLNSEELERVAGEVRDCHRCRLVEGRKNAVPGTGSYDADIMLIGEGPGKQEDEEGKPFVGRAGGLLDEILESVGIKREKVFITNIVKCRPPDNRDPRKDEISACEPYLRRQIELIDPEVIGTLGNNSTQTLIDKKGMSEIHGESFSYDGRTVVPLYHPAAGLYNPDLKSTMKEDMKKVLSKL